MNPKVKMAASQKAKEIHGVVRQIIENLAELDFILFIRVSKEYLQASSEVSGGRYKIPVTEPNHPTAIGVYLLLDIDYKNIQFYEITSAIRGCGGKMVEAVMNALPDDWYGVVVMDWSGGFWKKMKERHKKLYIM